MGFFDENIKAELEKAAGEAAKEAIDGKSGSDIAKDLLGGFLGGSEAPAAAPTDVAAPTDSDDSK